MRKSIIIISVFAFFMIGSQSKAQDMFTILEGKLSTTEQKQVENAQKDIESGTMMFGTAGNEFQKYANLFSSRKKRKRKKGERKTVGAKKKLIAGANKSHSGYSALYELYKNKVERYVIEIEADKQQIEELVAAAEKDYKSGESKLNSVKRYDEKALKKSVKYKSLDKTVHEGASKEKEAVEKLVDALKIAEAQEDKKVAMQNQDEEAWQDAVNMNTIPGYNNYISNSPNGKHIKEARERITKLEEEAKKQISEQQEEVQFYLQFAASDKNLSSSQIQSKLKKIDPYCSYGIMTDVIQAETHKYKYMFGPFENYEAARTYERNLNKREKSVFIVGYKDNGTTRITYITEALKGKNPSDTPTKKPIR